MHKQIYLFLALGAMACSSPDKEKNMSNETPVIAEDYHSAAQPNEARVTHLDWEASVDMNTKTISAIATWSINTTNDADEIHFDSRGLNISRIQLDNDTTSTPFEIGKSDEILGSDLSIQIKPSTKKVHIFYTTSPDAEALQWLSAEQTAGKKYPFLFTQSQAILARTWIPCQDSPGIRFTYNAKVKVPEGFLALMSAVNPTAKNDSAIYTFKQEKAIPAYLMALAVGDIAFKSIGERTGVYAEPATLDQAFYEFGEMDTMLVAAEKLYGKYSWNRYDVLVLPPSFPFGGMENPELTFATPTILAGDRSLVSLIAHEMAHSWSGNLVTNATWDDFWLNEGFTVYFERRIMESMEGAEYADMLASLGYSDLKETIEDFYSTGNQLDTHLKLSLKGRNPDDGMSDIAYEKGYCLLVEIEKAVGREKFDEFLKNYFHQFAFKTMTTEQFVSHLEKTILIPGSEAANRVNVKDWIYEAGIPKTFPPIESKRFTVVEASAASFNDGTVPTDLHIQNWSSHEWQYFLRYLAPNLSTRKMALLDETFHFTSTGNSEIAAIWFQCAIENNYSVAYPNLEEFLLHVGRRKFIKPLYEALYKNPATKKMALTIYKKARGNYHSVSTNTLDKMLVEK